MKTILQKFQVPFQYPVIFTHHAFHPENSILSETVAKESETARALLVVDSGIVNTNPNFLAAIKTWFKLHSETIELVAPPMIIPGGENAKNGWSNVRDIMTCIGREHIDRQSYLIAIGGGAVLDMAGFAASLVHRGIRLVRMPSTVLAQNDAGVGVKNGMNDGGAKNFVGTFAPPYAVINDLEILKTLPFREWISGVAEAFKVAVIIDKHFFVWLCDNAHLIKERNQEVMEQLIYRTAQLHLNHIATSGDPFETGSARPLDFGHWIGHRLEISSNFSIRHGEGVSIGIAVDSAYAALMGFITEKDFISIATALHKCGLPIYSDLLTRPGAANEPDIFEGIEQFREHLGGKLCVTLPKPVGSKIEVDAIDRKKLLIAMDKVKRVVTMISTPVIKNKKF